VGKLAKQPGVFLTAEWRNLLMLNYVVDPSLLKRFVPAGTELDEFEGKTYVSLVGFEFNRTRVCGLPMPFHQAFEEVNLRFYVKRSLKRGVVFIRELVPKFAVAAIARFAFNENYSSVPMSHLIETSADGAVAEAEYAWNWGKSGSPCGLKRKARAFFRPMVPLANSSPSTIGATQHNRMADASNTKFSIRDGMCGRRRQPALPETRSIYTATSLRRSSCMIQIPLSWQMGRL
jgi:hypothetical protein